MNKVIELANKAGFHTQGVIVRTIHSNGSWVSVNGELERFYTLARADLEAEIAGWKADQKENLTNQCELQAEINRLEAENAKLKQVLIDIAYGLEGSRIWGGMEWTYNPLHPFKYLPLRDAARAALGETK